MRGEGGDENATKKRKEKVSERNQTREHYILQLAKIL